ncbi:MAG: SRPBCC domain-containing protein [Odoribacter sp.]|nr:SRPBCC domain-containing protein [Odoribacter sp.]
MRKKIELEYIFSTSVKVLFPRLNTPSGLSEWFADDVYQRDGKFIFVWHDAENSATLLESKSNSYVRFQWDDGEEDEYFEFRIETQPLTKDTALIITDFTDEDGENDTVELWDKQVDTLRRNLGA